MDEAPRSPRRLINVTFRVDDIVMLYARGRALREGTSVNGMIQGWLEEYSGVVIPDEDRPKRRLPQLRPTRVRMTDDSYR